MNLESESTYNTTPGGITSIMLVVGLIWMTFNQTFTMFTNGNNSITQNESLSNFTTIGEIQMSGY